MNRQTDGEEAEIVLAEDVWLGANVTVLKGVQIGRGAIVAAGAALRPARRGERTGRTALR
jgi:acetyltransferase-like isoleucine patch superfamily enzyme